jgi:diguanylate cyclase (GGDEF)-like protein/PAS domain S-box-containing protein
LQEQLKQSEEKFRVLFDQAPIGYQSLDADGNILHVNQQWLDMFGYSSDEVTGKWLGDFIAPEHTGYFRRKFAEFIARGRIQCEMIMLTKSGRKIYVADEGKTRYDNEDNIVEVHCVTRDITARKEAQKKLRESEEKYGNYIGNAPNGILVIDQNGQIIEVNKATSKLTGYSETEMLGMNVLDVTRGDSRIEAIQALEDLLILNTTNADMQYLHKSGQERWANVSAARLSENRFLCFMSDITEQKRAAEKLLFSSTHDSMTGLCNRQFFDMEAERLDTQENLPLSILIGDINGLKLINDAVGHAEGDRIVVETAKFFSGFCKEGDVLARTGGDDFSFLLPKTDHKTAEEILHRILNTCDEHNQDIEDDLLRINLALATTTKETIDEEFTEVYKRAENIMQQRKLLEFRSSHSSTIASIRATMREKSHETEAHEERIAKMSRKVGMIMGLSQIDLDHIELLAQLHDIGKVGISEQILNKPGKLTPEEWLVMKKHPEIGERIALSTASLAPIAKYILCHHERWDGTGYPQGLAGEDIPLLSRIISIVDSYDAMTEDRVYQKAITHEEALGEIKRNAGTQFDPQISRIFCEEVSKLEKSAKSVKQREAVKL